MGIVEVLKFVDNNRERTPLRQLEYKPEYFGEGGQGRYGLRT